jgi:hypothetical protein
MGDAGLATLPRSFRTKDEDGNTDDTDNADRHRIRIGTRMTPRRIGIRMTPRRIGTRMTRIRLIATDKELY